MKRMIAAAFLFILCSAAFSQSDSFDPEKWQIDAVESKTVDHLGRKSLYLKGGSAVLKDVELLNGVIEFDMAFSEVRTFTGCVWRIQDANNYEEFYVRPHLNRKADAGQYTPVFNGMSAWQLYGGEGYWANIEFKYDAWNHVKIVISGDRGEVYFNDMEKPVVVFHEQKHKPLAGKIGLKANNRAPTWFSNFRYTSIDAPKLMGEPVARRKPEKETITAWQISSRFGENDLENVVKLSDAEKKSLQWQSLKVEDAGVANFSRLHARGQADQNTVFARLVIDSEKDQVKKIHFGYSDRVKVFVNDHAVYSGSNDYVSRDYRYLGTIGYFDSVYLPLRQGKNEVWFAVSENFGGWGIMAKLDSLDGVTLKY